MDQQVIFSDRLLKGLRDQKIWRYIVWYQEVLHSHVSWLASLLSSISSYLLFSGENRTTLVEAYHRNVGSQQ